MTTSTRRTDGERRRAKAQLRRYLKSERAVYQDLKSSLELYGERLAAEVRETLGARDLDADVSTRLKKWDKIEPKLEEGMSVLKIQDLVGVRVMVMYEDEVGQVTRWLQELFADRPFQRRWSTERGRKAGYAGVHVQARPSNLHRIRKALHGKFSAELQVRTHLQHVWSELSHDEFYKAANGVPSVVHDRLFRLAASLDVLSDEIVTIRNQLEEQSARLATRATDPMGHEWKSVQVDEFTLSVAGNESERFRPKLAQLREIAVMAGFRESAWDETVRVGLETDIFVPCARAHDIETLQDLLPLVDRALLQERRLKAVADIVKAEADDPEKHNLFARPLIVLSVVLMLENPARPCRVLSENILAAIQTVAVTGYA